MLTRSIGRPFHWLLDRIAAGLAATAVPPNVLTWLSLLASLWAGVLFAAGRFSAAGGTLILAGFCNIVDGPVARREGRVTVFGGFLSSTLDRYADLIVFLGLLVYYARVNRFLYAVLAGVAMAGAVMVSYAEARAESLIEKCQVGFWKRPERMVVLILGALVGRLPEALWLLAVGPNVTVIHRILYTWKHTEGQRPPEHVPVAPAEVSAVPAAPALRRSASSGRS
jgi:CDP-diacylglycerol--glycerol-3-phosphate 3-phosphatidyltransferase